MSSLGQPKVNKIKICLPFLKRMKRPPNQFHTHTMKNTKLLGQKKSKFIIRSKFIVGSNFSCNSFFSLSVFYWNYNNRYWYAFV